jgi:dihydrodipicolinate synthase/N-acetylneuraminate lyase
MSHYLYSVPPRSLRHVRTKAALKLLGIIASDMVREPLLPLDEAERRKLEQAMRSAGLLESVDALASAA